MQKSGCTILKTGNSFDLFKRIQLLVTKSYVALKLKYWDFFQIALDILLYICFLLRSLHEHAKYNSELV